MRREDALEIITWFDDEDDEEREVSKFYEYESTKITK